MLSLSLVHELNLVTGQIELCFDHVCLPLNLIQDVAILLYSLVHPAACLEKVRTTQLNLAWCFSPAQPAFRFYQTKTARQTYALIKKAIVEIQDKIAENRWKVRLCPETTGKPSQFGSVEELLKLMKDTGCGICVDFAHLYAREQGNVDYVTILKKLPKKFHAHFSGIEYGPKGERRHLKTTKQFFEPLARELIKQKLDVTLINESPRPFKDAAMMKRVVIALIAAKKKTAV